MFGQASPGGIPQVNVAPSGGCAAGQIAILIPAGTLYTCQNGTWGTSGGGGGGVTSVTGTTPIVSSGGSSPAISCATCTTNAAPLTNTNIVTGVSGNGTQASTATIDSSGNIVTPGSFKAGNASGKTGYVSFAGATSGANGFAVPDVAGTSILYLLPATAGAAGQFLQDNGSATCPTLPSGAPSTCHQLIYASPLFSEVSSTGTICTTPCPVTTSASATSMNWANIPASGTNLRLKCTIRSQNAGAGADNVLLNFNGDTTAAHYVGNALFAGSAVPGAVASAAAANLPILNAPQATVAANYAGAGTIDIPNYAQTTFFKSAAGLSSYAFGASVTAGVINFSGYWNSTAAVTAIALTLPTAGAFVNGSSCSLYIEQ